MPIGNKETKAKETNKHGEKKREKKDSIEKQH